MRWGRWVGQKNGIGVDKTEGMHALASGRGRYGSSRRANQMMWIGA